MAPSGPAHSVAIRLIRVVEDKEIPMSTTTPQPHLSLAVHDDPDMPGRYVTDGERLFRLLGPAAVRNNFIEIEDCKSLEVWLVDARELRSWGMSLVCNYALAVAA
jgi:hypothetical protein